MCVVRKRRGESLGVEVLCNKHNKTDQNTPAVTCGKQHVPIGRCWVLGYLLVSITLLTDPSRNPTFSAQVVPAASHEVPRDAKSSGHVASRSPSDPPSDSCVAPMPPATPLGRHDGSEFQRVATSTSTPMMKPEKSNRDDPRIIDSAVMNEDLSILQDF